MRHTATELEVGLAICIPSKRYGLIMGLFPFWLCGWLAGEVHVLSSLSTVIKSQPGAAAFLLFWLCGWTIGGALSTYTWLWQITGLEVVTVSPTALSIKHQLFGCGRTKRYAISKLRQIRIAPLTYDPFDLHSGMAFLGVSGVAIAFDYGVKTVWFGAGVEEAEARFILQTITDRLLHPVGL